MSRLTKICLAVVALTLLLGLVASATTPPSETTGQLKAVYGDKQEFVLADNQGKNSTFHLTSDAKVLINGMESKLEDLLAGERVSVTFEMQVDRPMASEVRCKRN